MNLDQSVRLQQRIQSFALTGILLTGLLVALATAVPMYRHVHALAERALADAARGQARAAGQFLAKSADLARQIASRSAVRDKLAEYNRWEISLAQLVDFSASRIRDALDQAGHIAGMVRFDRDGDPVLELGLPLPAAAQARPTNAGSDVVFHGHVESANGRYLLVSTPILSREGDWIGSDVLAFDLAPLEKMLSMHGADGVRGARQLLYHAGSATALEWVPQAERAAIVDFAAGAPAPLRQAVEGESGLLRRPGSNGDEVVVFLPVDEAPGWAYALVTPAQEFSQPIWAQLLFPLATIAVLVLLGALLTTRAIRPLTQRALDQSRRLIELSEEQRRAIGAQQLAEARLRHLAHHDALTDLPNRSLLNDRLGVAMGHARRDGQPLALLFIDLDRFKYVNDSLGHPVGDRLLQTVAKRLQAVLRDGDTLARLGGDEFVVLVEGLKAAEDAGRVAQKLLDALQAPVLLDGHELFVGGSIGISLFPQHGDTIEALVRCADSAMYRAKDAGRNTYRFHTREQATQSRERFDLEHGLRHAVARGELRLLYQPQADCRSGEIIGVEALLRWHHPERGVVPPDRFIPLAEEIGLIGHIGQWVLDTACAQARAWELAGRPLRVAVNLSGQQVSADGLVDVVRAALAASGLSPRLLELEITEGHILKRVEHCIDTLHQLKALGITLAIDDFGTGYSSLSYLKRLPVDRLKIDRSFVEGVPADHDDVAIVATILAMARNLGLAVIAEGVETPDQLAHLTAAQCAEYQGYLLGRPMPAADIPAHAG